MSAQWPVGISRSPERTGAECAPSVVARRRTKGHKTFVTLALVVGFLLAGEVGVRIRAWMRHGSGGPVADIYTADEKLGRRLRPGASILGTKRSVTINRWGFRGADVPRVKPRGLIRIAVLGDSTSFGMEASSDTAVWPARMAAVLESKDRQRSYDVINCAVPGYTLQSSAIQLNDLAPTFDPDFVVVYQASTDIAAHARRQFPSNHKTSRSGGVSAFVQKHSLLANLVRVNCVAFNAKLVGRQGRDRLDQRGVDAFRERLHDLVADCRTRGLDVILCTFPRAFGDPSAPTDQFQLAASALAAIPALSLQGLNDAYDRYNGAIRSVADRNDVPLVDLAEIVPKRAAFFTDAVHLNDAGHNRVGRAVAEVIGELAHPTSLTWGIGR